MNVDHVDQTADDGAEDDVGMAPIGKAGSCDRPRCDGVTSTGRSCRRVVVVGFDYCHAHLDQRTEIDQDVEV